MVALDSDDLAGSCPAGLKRACSAFASVAMRPGLEASGYASSHNTPKPRCQLSEEGEAAGGWTRALLPGRAGI